jgi:hypothetical protein
MGKTTWTKRSTKTGQFIDQKKGTAEEEVQGRAEREIISGFTCSRASVGRASSL